MNTENIPKELHHLAELVEEWGVNDGIINKLVLKEPSDGFLSIFRIQEKPSLLFVSEDSKLLMESQGIKGCLFNEL